MDIKLIVADLDGTLLNKKKNISNYDKKAITEAISKGYRFMICTGRGFGSISRYIRELGLESDDEYAIAYNGAYIATNTNKVLFEEDFDKDLIKDFIKHFKPNRDVDIVVYTSNSICYIDTLYDVETYINENKIYKMALEGEDKVIAKLKKNFPAKFKNQLTLLIEGKNIECYKKGTNKGKALKKLIKELGYKKSEVMALGDSDTDASMFEEVALPIVMANSISKNARAKAKYEAEDNDHSGVGKSIKRMMKDEYK